MFNPDYTVFMAKSRILILAASLALMCGTANAHRYYHVPHYYGSHYNRIPQVRAIVRTVPEKRTTVIARLTKGDRFEMAVAYLKANPSMSIKEYAKMTGLKNEIAEAELNVFSQDALNPIKPVPGKKNLYFLKG